MKMGIGTAICIYVAFIAIAAFIGKGFGDTLKRQPLDHVREQKDG